MIVSGSGGFVKDSYELWRSADGKKLSALAGSGVLAVSPDQKLLATSGYYFVHKKGELDTPLFRLHEVPSLRLVASGPARSEPLRRMAFDPQGKRLLVDAKALELWNVVGKPELMRTFSLDGKSTNCSGFSPDGMRVYACLLEESGDPSQWHSDFFIWNAANGDLLLRLPGDRVDYYKEAKWVGNQVFFPNNSAVIVLDASLDGLEDWENVNHLRALTEQSNNQQEKGEK